MKEYIFYTAEGITKAPDGENIENCQLLGRAYGNDNHDALSNLLKENPWIEKRGVSPYEAICKELVSTVTEEEKLSYLTSLLDKRQLEEYTNWIKSIE